MGDPSVRLEVSRIRNRDDLPVPPFPQQPELSSSAISTRGKLKLVQDYISSLEYNYTGEEFFVKKKDRGFRHVTSTAKLIIREALPIQCVEAVFVGAYLTAEMAEMDRFPVCFRSSLDGRVYRHIILAVRSASVWGALGLSRRDTLMYKELKYRLFSELMGDFRDSYASSWHLLDQIWVGFPLPHDISSNVPVKWKVMRANVRTESDWSSATGDLDRFAECAASLFERFSITGKLPDHPLLSESGSAKDTHGAPLKLPSNGVDSSNYEGAGDGGDDVETDPRGSPGAQSPGVRSPGFPACWLGPGGRRGSRRASTPVGTTNAPGERRGGGVGIAKGGSIKKNGGQRAAGGDCSSDSGGPSLIASPPRPRSRSFTTGGGRIAGTETERGRGQARGRESPGKSRRRIFKTKDSKHSDVNVVASATAATKTSVTGLSSDPADPASDPCVEESRETFELPVAGSKADASLASLEREPRHCDVSEEEH